MNPFSQSISNKRLDERIALFTPIENEASKRGYEGLTSMGIEFLVTPRVGLVCRQRRFRSQFPGLDSTREH
jgi:hypothetical protein